jgi:CRISPR-associated protein Csx3
VGRGYLGLHRAAGLRLFVEDAGGWRLLDLPSAYRTTPQAAQWRYVADGLDLRVTTAARPLAPRSTPWTSRSR